MSTQQSAPTQYITIKDGTKLAYRALGHLSGVPLVMLQHVRGSRPVITFDNTDIGKRNGEIPISFAGWADNVIAFVQALDLEQIDLLGYAMGGCAGQMVALNVPRLVRRLILAATQPSLGPGVVPGELGPFLKLAHAETPQEVGIAIAETCYYMTKAGKKATRESWERILSKAGGPIGFP